MSVAAARLRAVLMFHEPVLVDEVIEFLGPARGTVVDATCGGGGHTRAILERLGPVRLLALDLDAEALASAQRYLGSNTDNLILVQTSYVEMVAYVNSMKLAPVAGVLFDFGVSLHQVRTPGRGFSYDLDGPLDMRFDPASGPTALELLHRASADELRGWLREYGEEPHAGRLARLIHDNRRRIATTGDLAALVKRTVPFRHARRTLARVFQALRIVTNNELDMVRRGLEAAATVLAPGGRLVTISYHSLEDRICKRFMREGAAAGTFRLLARRIVRPSEVEVERNRAARSAKLRAAERMQ